VYFDADWGRGISNRKSRDVRGVYVLERYCVGGFDVAGMIDSKGTDAGFRRAIVGAVNTPCVPFCLAAAAAADEFSCAEFGACLSPTSVGFRGCWFMNEPNKGDVNGGVACNIDAVLDLDFLVAPSICAASALLRLVAASAEFGLIVPATPCLSEASEACSALKSLRSFGRSRKMMPSSLAFFMRSMASLEMKGPASLP
jgi:hypothetical protein